MITDFLLDHQWLSPAVLIALVVLSPVVGLLLADRATVAKWLAAISLLPVALITLVPQDRQLYARCEVQWTMPTPSRVELMANVVLFVAPVLFLALAMRRPMVALVVGSALSIAIEALQAAVPALGRSCDTNDWSANTMGAAIGAGAGAIALLAARRRRSAAD